MPKKNRRAIYEYLFKEGVMVAEKDFHKPVHPDLEGIPNLQVIKAMQVYFQICLVFHLFYSCYVLFICSLYFRVLNLEIMSKNNLHGVITTGI